MIAATTVLVGVLVASSQAAVGLGVECLPEDRTHFTWEFVNHSDDGASSEQEAAFISALDSWSDALGFTFQSAPPGQGDIWVAFTRFGEGVGAGATKGVGHPLGGCDFAPGLIDINDDFTFVFDRPPSSVLASGELDLRTLFLHELGHVLGLGHDGTSDSSHDGVMRSPTPNDFVHHHLTDADVALLVGHYPAGQETGGGGSGPSGGGSGGSAAQSASPQTLLDHDGRLWQFMVKESGSLYTRHWTSATGWSSFERQGVADSWSPDGTHAIEVDSQGRVWIAAIKQSGTLYVRSFENGQWSSFSQIGAAGAWSPSAGVALEPRSNGTITLAGVSQSGTLWHTTGGVGGWTGLTQHGQANSWSTTGLPAVALDTEGRLWIAAVKANGDLWARHYDNGSWGSSKLGSSYLWSPDAGIVMIPRSNGNVTLLGVTKTGTLYHVTGNPSAWTSLQRHGNVDSWSTTATPDIILGGPGYIWLGAVKANGTVWVRHYNSGSWGGFTRLGSSNLWSPDAGIDLVLKADNYLAMTSVSSTGTVYHLSGSASGWSQTLYQAGVSDSWAH